MRFCDIRNNQRRGNCYQPSRRPRLITLTDTLIIQDITKTESNNCFITHCFEENNDKNTVIDIIVVGNHALRSQPTQPVHRRCFIFLGHFSYRSFRKHRGARENERGARERKIILPPPLPPYAGGQKITCGEYILSPALDGLGRENRGSVNRLRTTYRLVSCLLAEK